MTDDARIEFHTHPDHDANAEGWELYRALYDGDRRALLSPGILVMHPLEYSREPVATSDPSGQTETLGQRLRRIRCQHSRYLNLFEPVVSNWISLAFSKPITVGDEVEKLLEGAKDDVDGRGTSLEDFIAGPVAEAYFRDGRPFIAVDAPGNDARSVAEERAAGFRPFMESVGVLSVKDWQVADKGPNAGKLEWVRHEYTAIEPRTSPREEPEEVRYSMVRSLAEGGVMVEVYKLDAEKGDWTPYGEPQLLAGWKEIPVSTIWTNEPWVKDVAEQQVVLFNLMSSNYNGLNMQAFQRVLIAGELGDKHVLSISEYAWGQIPTGAVPHIIEPSDNSSLKKEILDTVDQIFRVAFNRTRGQASDSKEAPGADTLREMQAELVNLLIRAIGEIETLVNQALRHYAMFKLGPEKGSKFAGKVTLSKDITVADVAQRIEMFATYRDEIRKVLPWRKAELKRAASEMGYGDDEVEEIFGAIDKLKDEPPLAPLAAMGPFAAKRASPAPLEDDGREADQESDE